MWKVGELNFSKKNLKETLRKHFFWWQQFCRLWIFTHCKFLEATQINVSQDCLGCGYSCLMQCYRLCDFWISCTWFSKVEHKQEGRAGMNKQDLEGTARNTICWVVVVAWGLVKSRSSNKRGYSRRRIQYWFGISGLELSRSIIGRCRWFSNLLLQAVSPQVFAYSD